LKYSCKAVDEALEESNLIHAALNDRIEKVIAVLEDKHNVAGILGVLKGEADEVFSTGEELTNQD
jgi:hypothetical protein